MNVDYGFQAIEQCIAKPFEMEDFVADRLLRTITQQQGLKDRAATPQQSFP